MGAVEVIDKAFDLIDGLQKDLKFRTGKLQGLRDEVIDIIKTRPIPKESKIALAEALRKSVL